MNKKIYISDKCSVDNEIRGIDTEPEKSHDAPDDCPWPENNCKECFRGTLKGCLGPRGDIDVGNSSNTKEDTSSNRY